MVTRRRGPQRIEASEDPWSDEEWRKYLGWGRCLGHLTQARLANDGTTIPGWDDPASMFVPSVELAAERWQEYRAEIIETFAKQWPDRQPWGLRLDRPTLNPFP